MPNVQDEITDPSTLIGLLTEYRDYAQYFAELMDPYGNDPPPLVDCTIPAKLTDGRTVEVREDAPEVWASGLLETYVHLPERFRDYWRQMADAIAVPVQVPEILDTSKGYGVYGPEEQTVTDWDVRTEDPGYMQAQKQMTYTVSGAVDPQLTTVTFANPRPEEPEWSGAWPTGYYHNTLPQLIEALYELDVPNPPHQPQILPYDYVGWYQQQDNHILNPDGSIVPAKPPYRYDYLRAGGGLSWYLYLRNYSENAVLVPYSVAVSNGGTVMFTRFSGNMAVEQYMGTSALSGNVEVPPHAMVRIQLYASAGVLREEEILVDPENPGSLDPNRFIGEAPTVSVSMAVGGFSLARVMPPLFTG